MAGLRIAPDLKLPIEAVTETFAILAKRGKGKTNTAVVMAEEMIEAGLPVVVLDPVGVWWGIRAAADGKADGLPVVIFGGDHADVPLEATAGELIADVIVDRRISAVIDLSSLSKSAARKFMEREYLSAQVAALLPTPRSSDPAGEFSRSSDGFRPQLGEVARTVRQTHGPAWGDYAPAIARWELIIGRIATAPTQPGRTGNPQLSAAFVEWLMGLPAGWVTDVPGITRNEALKALGNGVVPQQATAALRWMLHRAAVAA